MQTQVEARSEAESGSMRGSVAVEDVPRRERETGAARRRLITNRDRCKR